MNDRAVSRSEIRAFYDRFLGSRMFGYRLAPNPRIERAIERALPFVRPTSRVLDIGCGIGLVAERLAIRARHGRVWACDLSERNVAFAQQTVSRSKVEFFVCDVLDNFARVRACVNEPIDVVVLVDVIEHLPFARAAELFSNLRAISAPSAILILTYPSPAYQQYLREFEPEELQPVDEIIDPAQLLYVADKAGFTLRHYSLQDVWRTGQYVHCVLETQPKTELIRHSWPAKLCAAAGTLINRLIIAPLRHWRYGHALPKEKRD